MITTNATEKWNLSNRVNLPLKFYPASPNCQIAKLPNHEIGNMAIWQSSVIKLQLIWSPLCLINSSSLLEKNQKPGFEITDYTNYECTGLIIRNKTDWEGLHKNELHWLGRITRMKEGVDCREVPLWVLGVENDDKNNIWHQRGSHVTTMVISVNMQIFRGLKNNHCNGKMPEASNVYRKMISQSDVRPPRGRIMFAWLIFYNHFIPTGY